MTRAAPKTDLGGFRPREKVYTRGDSDSGQLGLGGYAPRHTFTQVGALRALQVTHVAAGLAHSAAVTALGKLMTWGAAEFGQLGLGNPHLVGADVDHPRGVKFVAMGKDAKRQNLVPAHEVRFVSVACGDCHTLALSSNAFLYTCGQGTFGALGLGDYGNQSSPTCVLSLATAGIVQAAAGANHSAALGIDGKVFTWGRGKYGQLGLGTYSSSAFPIHVSSLQEPVLKIACGNDHTLLLGKSGAVYAFGRGNAGQTGLLQAEPLARKAVAGRKADRAPGQRLALCAACKINTVATQGHFAGPNPLCAPLCRECFARRGPPAVELVEFDDLEADNRV